MRKLRTSFSYTVIFNSLFSIPFYLYFSYLWIPQIIESGESAFTLPLLDYCVLIVILAMGINIIGGFLLTPISITIKDDSIRINRLLSHTVIHKKDVVFIRSKKSRVKDSIVIGSNILGLLGYSTEPNWGKYISYITDTNKMVAIETTNKKYVVSCKNPQMLIDCIKEEEMN